MRSTARAVPPDVLVEEVPSLSLVQAASNYLGAVAAMVQAELHRVRREPSVLVARTAQPLLWLLVFGSAVSRVRGLGIEGVPYKAFLVPGVLAQSVIFVAIFSGLAIIWERDLGITQRVLVVPVPRSAILLGKAASTAMRAVVLSCLVLAVVAVAGIPLDWSVPGLVGALAAVALGAMLLSALSMVIASAVRTRGAVHGARPADHPAAAVRLERALLGVDHAGLAPGRRPGEPADLPGGAAAAAARRRRSRPAAGRRRRPPGRHGGGRGGGPSRTFPKRVM